MMCVEYMVNIGQSYGDPPYFHVKLIKVIHNNSYFLNTLYIYIYIIRFLVVKLGKIIHLEFSNYVLITG